MVKLIVGLGNPGRQYVGTRHNLGFAVVEKLSRRWGVDLCKEKFSARCGEGHYGEQRVILLKPLTFMNRSGQTVWSAVRFYRAEPEQLLILSDDAALPLGQLRMRARGSAGGHKGLQSVVDRTGCSNFARLRLGIDQPGGVSATYVLSRFAEQELPVVEAMVATAADAVECWIEQGPDATMNRFNRKANGD